MAKLGKASSLPGILWNKWLKYVLGSLGAKPYVILWMTQALCLRVTQVLQLKVSDFRYNLAQVRLKKFKRSKGTNKPLPASVSKVLQEWKLKGVKSARGGWSWPEKGFMFPARSDAKKPHLTKDYICHKIAKVRAAFMKKNGIPKNMKVRSHSGRRHCISAMALGGVPDQVGMAWAQIKEHRVYRGYVDLDPLAAFPFIADFDKKMKLGKK